MLVNEWEVELAETLEHVAVLEIGFLEVVLAWAARGTNLGCGGATFIEKELHGLSHEYGHGCEYLPLPQELPQFVFVVAVAL